MNEIRSNRILLSHMLLILACLAWGGSYAVGRYGLNTGSAIWLTLWRWGLGAIFAIIYIAMCWSSIGTAVKSNLGKLTFISVLGIVIYPASLFLAISATTALNASLYLAVTPTLIVLISSIVWGEKVHATGWIGIATGLVGMMVLLFRGDIQSLLNFRVATNDFWAIISAVSWAAYCVSLPLKPKELGQIQFLAVMIAIGTLILVILGLSVGIENIPIPQNKTTTFSIIYFAIFPSILAFLAWNYATSYVGPSVAAPYNNLVPLFGGMLGIWFLGETIEVYHMVGGGFILLSLLINGTRR